MKKTSSFIVVILTVFALVNAQDPKKNETTTKAEKPKPSAVSTDTKTRTRRTEAAATAAVSPSPTPTGTASTAQTKPTDADSDAKPAESPATDATAAKPETTKPASAKPEQSTATEPAPTAPADPIMELRDQIDAAETPQERIRLQLQLADEFVRSGQKELAMNELHQVIADDTFAPQDYYNAGNSLARLGDADAAIAAYRKAIDQRKGIYSRALNNLGVVLLRAGRWQESYEALTSALRIESFHYPEASYNLGRLYATRGETDLAVREWKRVLSQNPNHTAAREALAQIGYEGRVEVVSSDNHKLPPPPKGEPASQSSKSEEIKPAPVFTTGAASKPVAVKSPSTPGSSTQALAVDQVTYDFLQRARTSSEHGKAADAIDSYKKAISRQNGYLPPANLELSYLLVNEKRYDEALTNLLLVANRDGSRYPISYFHLARLYELRGDLKQAEVAYSQAAQNFKPANAQFLLDLSRVREKQGNVQGAVDAIEQYVAQMKQQGQTVSWSEERLAQLRQKLNAPK